MDYEKKYEEALERARDYYEFYKENPAKAQPFIDIFPELAESEDERIRKELIEYLRSDWDDDITTDDTDRWIAWLEKQKEQKPGTTPDNPIDPFDTKLFQDGVKEGRRLEREEQKLAEWTNDEKDKLNRIYRLIGIAADEHAYSTTCRLIGDKEAVELQDFLRSLVKPQEDLNIFKKNMALSFGHYLDEHCPEDKMCISNGEWEDISQAFVDLNWGKIIRYVEKYQPKQEWSVEDEDRIRQIERIAQQAGCTQKLQEEIHNWLKSLCPQPHLSKEEFIKFGNLEYERGKADGYKKATEEYNKHTSYHFPVMPTFGCDGIHCTNPQMDCINCPRKLTGGNYTTTPNTATTTGTQWKPSEEQMCMLRAIINDSNNAGSESCHLAMESLYNDLKAL